MKYLLLNLIFISALSISGCASKIKTITYRCPIEDIDNVYKILTFPKVDEPEIMLKTMGVDKPEICKRITSSEAR